MRNKSCVNLMQCRANTDAGARKNTRWAPGPSFQTALNSQGGPAFQVCVSRTDGGELQAGTFSRASLETQQVCSEDSLLGEGQKVQMGNKVLKWLHKKGTGRWGGWTIDHPRLHTVFFFLSLLEHGFFFPSFLLYKKKKMLQLPLSQHMLRERKKEEA